MVALVGRADMLFSAAGQYSKCLDVGLEAAQPAEDRVVELWQGRDVVAAFVDHGEPDAPIPGEAGHPLGHRPEAGGRDHLVGERVGGVPVLAGRDDQQARIELGPRQVFGLVNSYVLHKITDPQVVSALRRTVSGIDESPPKESFA